MEAPHGIEIGQVWDHVRPDATVSPTIQIVARAEAGDGWLVQNGDTGPRWVITDEVLTLEYRLRLPASGLPAS